MLITFNMTLNLYLFQNIFFLLIYMGDVLPQSPCDDWKPYEDETCLEIFNTPGVLDYDDAERYCEQQSANLMSINLQDKQDFIENFLKSNEVTDNVWLGLKYTEEYGYEWLDGTPLNFANWAEGNPKNDSSYCVQMHTEEEEYGKWSEVACSRKNLVLCEKIQLWSSSKIQSALMNLMRNPVPIGFIYVQLPKEKLPNEIWPWLGWKDITSDYAGVFFRAEGGNSSFFGNIQEENSPRMITVTIDGNQSGGLETKIDLQADNEMSKGIRTAIYTAGDFLAELGLRFRVSSGEVRPRNMAIRIWKRVK